MGGIKVSMNSNSSRDDLELELTYHPFDQVPNELLALILVWTSKGLDNDDQRFLFPLLIPQLVSRRWKEVAFTTPALWTTLRVDKKLPFESLEMYLEKSGGLNISLNIIRCDFLPLLVQSASRWKRVNIWTESEAELNSLIKKISLLAVSLRYLSVISPRLFIDGDSSINIRLIRPELESLHLTYVSLDWKQAQLSLENLSELVLRLTGTSTEEVDLQRFLDALIAFPRLKCLKIFTLLVYLGTPEQWLSGNSQFQKILLSGLEELVLSDLFINEFLFIASLINSPNLRSLGIGLIGAGVSHPRPEVHWDSLSPVYPRLNRLDLWSLPEDPETLHLAVQNIRSVNTLGVRGGGLTKSTSYEPYFKMLRHICSTVHTLQTRSIDIGSLCQLVKNWFPKIETTQVYWRDVGMVGAVNHDQLPNITLWGKGEEVWHLEGLVERMERIDRIFER